MLSSRDYYYSREEVFNSCTKDGDQMFLIFTEGQTKNNQLNLQHEGFRLDIGKFYTQNVRISDCGTCEVFDNTVDPC